MRTRMHYFVPAFLFAALALTSCSKSSTSTTAQNDNTAAQPVSVSHIEIGRAVDADKRVTDQTRDFKPNETIYASVLTNGNAPNTEIKVRWTFQDGQVVDESSQSIAPQGAAATEFHISKPDGWPAGTYKVEVFVNGNPAGSEQFEVKRTS